MQDENEKYRYLKDLSNDALYTIIHKDFSDYEEDALNEAKEELERRSAAHIVMGANTALFQKEVKPEITEYELEYDLDAVKKRLVELPEEDVRNIIYKDSEEYRQSAIDAAKEELLRRNRDILDTGSSDTVKIEDVIYRVDFQKAFEVIDTLCPELSENRDSYQKVFFMLKQMSPVETDVSISIEYGLDLFRDNWNIYGNTPEDSENFSVEFFQWSEWLGFSLPKETLLLYGRDVITALCLLKMTSNGFSEEEIQQRLSDIDDEFAPKDAHEIP